MSWHDSDGQGVYWLYSLVLKWLDILPGFWRENKGPGHEAYVCACKVTVDVIFGSWVVGMPGVGNESLSDGSESTIYLES